MEEERDCGCGGTFQFDGSCAAYVCYECGNHLGLDRCWCGWSRSGRDGRQELLAMGETIEED